MTGLSTDEADRLTSTSPPAGGPPSPALLHAHYAAAGDQTEARWRLRLDHFVDVTTHAHPGYACAALELAMPNLAPMRVRSAAGVLYVSAAGHVVRVSRVVRHARIRGLEVREAGSGVHDIARAANVILATNGAPQRFVELRAPADRQMLVAVSSGAGRLLQGWGATTHRDVASLLAFTGWPEAGR